MGADLSQLSDEELERIAGGGLDLSALSDEELEQIAGSAAPARAERTTESTFGDDRNAVRENILQTVVPFADEIRGVIEGGIPELGRQMLSGGENPAAIVEAYRNRRDAALEDAAVASADDPTGATVGKALGIGGAIASSGVNPVSAVRGLAAGGRALLAGTPGAARGLLESGVRGVVGGAAVGGVYAAGASEADLTRGEFGELAEDIAEGAKVGAVVGFSARGLLGSGQAGAVARVSAAEEKAASALAKDRDSAVRLTGLDGKQKTLGGPKRAKERAQALYDEPSPLDPSKRLLDEVEGASPDARLDLASSLKRAAGEKLGKVRDELAETGSTVPVAPLRDQIRGAFADLPTEVQTKALEQVDAMIGAAAKDGAVPAAALRKLIEDAEGLAKFGTPNLEAALGNARGRVFGAARAVLTGAEKELVAKALPGRVPEYTEALRRYGVYSDFEMGSKVILERANKGQKLIRQPAKENGGRGLLALAGSELGARAGALVPLPGATLAGARAGEALVERWGRWLQPSVATTSAKVKKLEKLQPMMEEAMRKGPAEVARIHALFMQRSPDYRKAIESAE